MAPDSAGDWVEWSHGLDASDRPAEPLVPHHVAEAALVHVQQHGEGVRHSPLVVVGHRGGVVAARLDTHVVVEHLQPAQVPAPALVRVAHQALVTHGVQRSLAGGHAHHGVRAPLSDGPGDLPHVETGRVANFTTDTVRALGDGVASHHQGVVLLQHNVEGFVIGVPGIPLGDFPGHRRRVEDQRQFLRKTRSHSKLLRRGWNLSKYLSLWMVFTIMMAMMMGSRPLMSKNSASWMFNLVAITSWFISTTSGRSSSDPLELSHVKGHSQVILGRPSHKSSLDTLPSEQFSFITDTFVDDNLIWPTRENC